MGDAVGESLLLFMYKVKVIALQGNSCAEVGV